MADKIPPPSISLDEFRTILERRKTASLQLAGRTPATRYSQAANDEAAFFGGLRDLLDELVLARSRLHGDSSRPLKRLRLPVTKVALMISGGALTAVLANGQQVEVAVIDYDADGFERIATIPQTDGSSEEALVSRPRIEVDAQRVDELFRVVDEAEQEFASAGLAPPSV